MNRTSTKDAAHASSFCASYGRVAKLYINTDSVAIGLKTDSNPCGQKGENKAVKINGAVSPAALAIDNTTPVAIGVKAEGRVIRKIVTNLDAPTPR